MKFKQEISMKLGGPLLDVFLHHDTLRMYNLKHASSVFCGITDYTIAIDGFVSFDEDRTPETRISSETNSERSRDCYLSNKKILVFWRKWDMIVII